MDARTDLPTYLSSRHTELSRRRDRVEAELADLYAEIDDVEKAAKAVGIDLSTTASKEQDAQEQIKKDGELTIKEAALDVLGRQSNGLTANEILALLDMMHGMQYMRSSLSPQLSRLKGEGKISLRDGRWYLNNPIASPEMKPPSVASETEKPAFQRRHLL